MTDDASGHRRDALLARRDALRARQAERMAQQQHAEQIARFDRHLGAALTQAGVRHEVLWGRQVRKGPLLHYPIGFASVHWDLVPHAVSVYGGSDEALKTLLDDALRALAIAAGATVIVDWGMAGEPRLALSAADASTHAIALMRHGSDMWVYADDAAWLIEVHHEGTLTHAARPGLPEHAGDGWRPKRRGNRERPPDMTEAD